jgi:activating signal cointegrator 1
MKALSIWQPYASLLVHGWKMAETRSWNAPSWLIGKEVAICSTRRMTPEQLSLSNDKAFMSAYAETELPEISELPMGKCLGTVVIHSSDPIIAEDLDEITEQERLFGWWRANYFAWRVRYPVLFDRPFDVVGKQGIWDISDALVTTAKVSSRESPSRKIVARLDI